jgi:hypothetical protein
MKRLLNCILVIAVIYTNVGYWMGYYKAIKHNQTIASKTLQQVKVKEQILTSELSAQIKNEINLKISILLQPDLIDKSELLQIRTVDNGINNLSNGAHAFKDNFFESVENFIKNNLEENANSSIFFKIISNCNNLFGDTHYLFNFSEIKNTKYFANGLIVFQSYILDVLKPPPNN